jgi:hypothetical protein
MHLTYPDLDAHMGAVSPSEKGEAGAPAREIEITPEMIDDVTSIIIRADYRFESERDVAKEILHSIFRKFL